MRSRRHICSEIKLRIPTRALIYLVPTGAIPCSVLKELIPEGISLSLVTQQENQILLQGISNSYSIILDLVENLNELDAVQSVQIESVIRIVEEEYAAVEIETGDESQPSTSTNPSYSFSILTFTSGEEGLP